MAASSTDVKLYYTGGDNNRDGSTSRGGRRSIYEIGNNVLGDLFARFPEFYRSSGLERFRAVSLICDRDAPADKLWSIKIYFDGANSNTDVVWELGWEDLSSNPQVYRPGEMPYGVGFIGQAPLSQPPDISPRGVPMETDAPVLTGASDTAFPLSTSATSQTTSGTGISIASIPGGSVEAGRIWIRQYVKPSASSATADSVTLRIDAKNRLGI